MVEKLLEEIKQVKDEPRMPVDFSTNHFLYMDPFAKMLEELQPTDTDFVWFTITLHLVNLFGSQDPLPIHFSISRMCLKQLGIENDSAVDMLTRALVVECRNFKDYIFKIFCIQDKSIAMGNNHLIKQNEEQTWFIPEKDSQPNFQCKQDKCNAIDLVFCEFLKMLGKCGQETSLVLKESAPKRYQRYNDSQCSFEHRKEAWSVWIAQDNSLLSPFLSILANVVWNDTCKQRWDREKKNVPALPQGVLIRTIRPPLSKDTKIEVTQNNTITCFSENGTIISTVPCVDPKLVNLICKGMECLSSLNGHKLIRWQVKTGFNNWVNCVDDPRLICTSGGYEGIANLIGSSNSNKAITEVKAMLHAQAYGQFSFPQGGAGNMLILREIEKHRNGEPSKINIILGEFLLPNFTHLLPQGEKRRLVPITDLPPLIGSNNTHAAQAMLQLLILEEFSNQSDRFATNGSILLTKDKLQELAFEAKLPKASLERVIKGWTEDDLFSNAFLQQQGDEYTLGKTYARVIGFLEYQGKQRIDGARGGEKSATSKKNLITRKYTKRSS